MSEILIEEPARVNQAPQPEAAETPFQTGLAVTISTGHAVHDTYTGFLPPLLPPLIEKFALTNTAAGFLTLFLQLPSILQPLIGNLADRLTMRYLVILAPAITGTMMSLLGVGDSYIALAVLLLVAGTSSAGLHAVGPVMTGRVSGSRLGKGMGFWMVGGEIGRTIGPVLLVTAIAYLTLDGLPWLMVGGWLTSGVMVLRLHQVPGWDPTLKPALPWREAVVGMRPFMLPLAGILTARAFATASLTTYLPVYLTDRGVELWYAGAALTVLEAAGVIGALLGGAVSDRMGRRQILLASMVGTSILIIIFMFSSGILLALLIPMLGFVTLSTTPVIMAWVQESYPENRALANGIYMALGFLIRAGIVVLLGRIGDIYGLQWGMMLSALMMIIGIPLAVFLPSPGSGTSPIPSSGD